MANTNVKAPRAPRTPRTPKAPVAPVEEPEVTTTAELDEVETTPVATPEPEVEVAPKVEQKPEPESEPKKAEKAEPAPKQTCTEVYLVQRGEKYNVFRGTKKLTRNTVLLEKAKIIALGYGESNPTIL